MSAARGGKVRPMTLAELLSSLTPAERDFIASRDYGADKLRHRAALDVVIANGGEVDFTALGVWHPYEVIELCKNDLKPGHEREYTACMGIVLLNIKVGRDRSNDKDMVIESQQSVIWSLPAHLREVLDPFL